jgi:hypothetical protein
MVLALVEVHVLVVSRHPDVPSIFYFFELKSCFSLGRVFFFFSGDRAASEKTQKL